MFPSSPRLRGALRALLLASLVLVGLGCSGDERGADSDRPVLRVAVASNFAGTMSRLAALFTAESGVRIEQSAGSTGKLYAQIVNGAPFDVLLAADAARPERLVAEGRAESSTLTRYAAGRLVLAAHRAHAAAGSPANAARPPACLATALGAEARAPIALANPAIAPYGVAAEEVLAALGRADKDTPARVQGENVSQVLHFVASGNAGAGFVAAAQLADDPVDTLADCRWNVPASLHAPIEQKLVVTRRAAGRAEAHAFVRFMTGPTARRVIAERGYDL